MNGCQASIDWTWKQSWYDLFESSHIYNTKNHSCIAKGQLCQKIPKYIKNISNSLSVPNNSEVLCKKCNPFANSPTLPGFFCLAIDPNVTFQKGSESLRIWKASFQELEMNHLLLKPVAEVNFAMNSIIHQHGKSLNTRTISSTNRLLGQLFFD